MIGYTVGVTLFLSCLLAAITMARLFNRKPAGIWGRATGVVLAIFAVALILWATVEMPAYERQQAQINYQAGQEYLASQEYELALNSFQKISKVDTDTFNLVQPLIAELRLQASQIRLENAQVMYADQQYPQALQELQTSLQYYELEESKALLPVYQAAAGKK